MSAVANKLREARALVERGWCQGKFRKYVGDDICYCADGALNEVFSLGESGLYMRAVKPLIKAMGVREHAYMWGWNDAPERTQAEVVAAFDKAIELAEQSA